MNKINIRLSRAMLLIAAMLIISVAIGFALAFRKTYAADPVQPPVPTATSMITPSPKVTATPEPSPSPIPSPTPVPVYNAKLAVVGDLMVHEWQFNDAYKRGDDAYNFDYCFEEIKDYLADADYTIGNLETTFAGKDAGYGYYPLFNAPDEFLNAIVNAGFDFVTTANNHCNDKREAGILRTLKHLDSYGIGHTGTFSSQTDRDTLFMTEINNITFAFLSYTYSTNGIPLPDGKGYLVNMLDEKIIKNDISWAKKLGADVIVVLPHMGNEYETVPNSNVKSTVRMMMEAGADIVLASHPHVLQPAERITIDGEDGSRECFVIYSLGNFISSQRTVPRDQGIILNLYFEKKHGERVKLTDVEYIPTWVQFMNAKGQYDIKVLPVRDTINKIENGQETGLRNSDITRIRQVDGDIKKIYGNLTEGTLTDTQ